MSSEPIEIHFDKRLNNLTLVQTADRGQRREYLVVTLLALLMVFGLMAYGWQHYQFRDLGYRIEAADKEHTRLVKDRENMRTERQSLRSSERIDEIAIKDLGMTMPSPGQVRSVPLDGSTAADAELAAQQ